MNVVQLKSKTGLPSDFAAALRTLADQVEAGEVSAFVGVAVINDTYDFIYPSSLADSLMLASLLQHRSAARFTEHA